MKIRFPHSLVTAAATAAALSSVAQSLQLISTVDSVPGPPAGAGGDSWAPIISPDARYVLFAGTANKVQRSTTRRPSGLGEDNRFPREFS